MRILATLAALAVSVSASAAESTYRDLVLRQVMNNVHAPRLVISAKTAGGAEHFISQWTVDRYGSVVGGEMAKDFADKNRSPHNLGLFLEQAVIIADLTKFESGETYDWDALDQAYPGATVARISEPGFDGLSMNAVVRVDLISRERAFTRIQSLQRYPIDQWRMGPGAEGLYAPMHRTDTYLHPPHH